MDLQFSPFGKFMIRLCIAGVVILAVWLLSVSVAKADGCSYKDCGAPSASIREYLSPEEMRIIRRIKDRAEARRANRLNPQKQAYYDRLNRRDLDPRPVRYSRSYRSYTDESRGAACKAPIKVTGVERTYQWRAEESARKAWRREVTDRHGYQFGGNFRNVRVTCDEIRQTVAGPVYVCRASGRPCRED